MVFLNDVTIYHFVTGWMIGGSIPGRGWEFFSSPPCQDRLWGPIQRPIQWTTDAFSLG